MFAVHAPALVDYIYLISHYPQRGGHAIVEKTGKSPGGAGANVANNLASLDVGVELYTTLGRDEDAEFFVERTAADVKAEITDDKTGKVHVFVDREGERTFFVEPNAAGKPFVRVDGGDYLYLDPFPSEKSFEMQIGVARDFEGFVILNPGFPYVKLGFERLKVLLLYTNMLIMSSDEFNSLRVDVRDLLNLVDYLIVTQGKLGSVCYTKEKSFQAKAFPARVVDSTGAGDAFAAGFIYGFIHEMPLDICLRIGNFCGAYNVERLGARNFPSKGEIEDFLASILRRR